MVASLQSHIDDLVQKNRTFEHTVKKLQQALQEEKERAKHVVVDMKAAGKKEQLILDEWREKMLSAHRIHQLLTLVELQKARIDIANYREDLRKEKVNVLDRDYRLTLFQAKVFGLEEEIERVASGIFSVVATMGEGAFVVLGPIQLAECSGRPCSNHTRTERKRGRDDCQEA